MACRKSYVDVCPRTLLHHEMLKKFVSSLKATTLRIVLHKKNAKIFDETAFLRSTCIYIYYIYIYIYIYIYREREREREREKERERERVREREREREEKVLP